MTHYSNAVRDFGNGNLEQIRGDIVQIRRIVFEFIAIVSSARANMMLRESESPEAFYWLHAIFAAHPRLATKPAAYPLDMQHAFASTTTPFLMTCIASVSPILWEDPDNIYIQLLTVPPCRFYGVDEAEDAIMCHYCASCQELGDDCCCDDPGNVWDYECELCTDVEEATAYIIRHHIISTVRFIVANWDDPTCSPAFRANQQPRFIGRAMLVEQLYEDFAERRQLAIAALTKKISAAMR